MAHGLVIPSPQYISAQKAWFSWGFHIIGTVSGCLVLGGWDYQLPMDIDNSIHFIIVVNIV